jgi:quercetin dioxygenase-like cupin family protein
MNHLRTTAIACSLSFVVGAGAMWAQQQTQSTTRREPQFENEHVRVWKSIIMPKQPLTQHRHEHGRALIALTNGQLHVVDKDGKVVNTYDWKKGKAYWLDADPPGQTHADRNDTSRPIEVIVVELKNDR